MRYFVIAAIFAILCVSNVLAANQVDSIEKSSSSKNTANKKIKFLNTLTSLECIRQASFHAKLPEALLLAIAMHESGFDNFAKNINTNGSLDVGLMQINSIHWDRISKQWGVKPSDLLNPCVNALIAAILLREHIAKHGLNSTAIGYYHSSNPYHRQRYAVRVCKLLQGTSICK